MDTENRSLVTEFVLLGLSEDPHMQIFLFVIFFTMYVTALFVNITLFVLCIVEPRLHKPMYFFLAHLSVVDIFYSSLTVPNILIALIERKRIGFPECAAGMYFVLFMGCTECVVLTIMSFDRYVAIVYPLRYSVIMNKANCIKMAVFCWLTGSLLAFTDAVFILRLPFCGSGIIDHYFCEAVSLLRMSCVDAFVPNVVLNCVAFFALIIPTFLTFVSYVRIVATILGIRSSEGRYKAFSTCGSHLLVVTMFYFTATFMYIKPVPKGTEGRDKVISVFYTVTPAMVNPLIYSLRNKDVKFAMQKLLQRGNFH